MARMRDIEKQKQIEDEVVSVLSCWPEHKLAIAYKWIRNQGITASCEDAIIRKGLQKETENSDARRY